MMEKINKRRLKLLYKLVKTTRINRDFFRYVGNHIAKARLDRKKTLKIVHPTNVMIELGNVCNLHCWRTRQTLWRAVQMLTQKLCCQTIHDCPKVVPLHYESE